ncbi:MAG: ParB N-terminal domain-containing protein [Methylocystaceae bacterium]|nr:ParB N-terminal domain-containing protein [Methylocystaceae bacterium]
MITRFLPLSSIIVEDRLRDSDEEEVKKLSLSIKEIGQQTPIIIRPYRKVNPKDKTKWLPVTFDGLQRWILIAGLHRFEAIDLLGLEGIHCIIKDPTSPLEARLLEIDENVYRHELNAWDLAVFLRERKAIYEELYPQSKRGGDQKSKAANDQNAAPAFSKSAEELTGLKQRTIQESLRISEGIAPELEARIKGTWLSKKKGELLHLAGCDHETQARILDMMLREEKPITKVNLCKRELDGKTVKKEPQANRSRKKLFAAWDAADKALRSEFLQHLADTGYVLPASNKEAA